MWAKIKSAYGIFENWVQSWMPGFKTIIVSGLGVIGSTCAVLQQYITNLPLDKFATASQIAFFTLGVSLLALWFHGMADRVDARTDA